MTQYRQYFRCLARTHARRMVATPLISHLAAAAYSDPILPSTVSTITTRPRTISSKIKPKMTGNPIHVKYTSNKVDIPDSFLTTPPAKPITSTPVDFVAGGLPEYKSCIALVLDNVLSPEECKEMLRLVEASVPVGEDGNASPWKKALVSLGLGLEAPAPGYRESWRIIWDEQTVANRVWDRCLQVEGLRELLATVEDHNTRYPGTWWFSRPNDRLRFLKYTQGQYFMPHTDGPYWYTEGEVEFMTQYTVHLYLNDSVDVNPESDLVGGTTAFLSRDKETRLDLAPRAGSVLIFQHDKLYHEGAEVHQGTKYTMRTDLLYRFEPKEKKKA